MSTIQLRDNDVQFRGRPRFNTSQRIGISARAWNHSSFPDIDYMREALPRETPIVVSSNLRWYLQNYLGNYLPTC